MSFSIRRERFIPSRDQTWSRCLREQVCSRLRAAIAFVILCNLGLAQEDPFGAVAKAAAAPKVDVPVGPAQREPLVIELLRRSNPTTPEQLVAAAQTALQFGRPDEAKAYLTKLLEAKPNDEALAPVAARYGDLILQLTRTPELQPEGKQAAGMLLAAAQRFTQNSERIEAAIKELSSPDHRTRQDAVEKLAQAGTAIVNPMLHALADQGRQAEHSQIRTALVQLAGTTELPLLAALDTADSELKKQIIAVLGRMGSLRAAVYLVRPAVDAGTPVELRQLAAAALQKITGTAPDFYEAEKYLTRQIAKLMRGDVPFIKDALNQVQFWSWDPASQGVVSVTMPARDAGMLLAARMANDLYALKPSDDAARRLMLLTNLDIAKVLGGLDRPLPTGPGTAAAVALQFGAPVVNQVLADALAQGRIPAAIAAAEVLGQAGDPAVLHTHSGGASPLATAMLSSDRRVRLAAALATVRLSPGDSFRGASRVSETLGWFLNTGGTGVVFIGHPRGEDAQSLVGFMNALGYDATSAYVGRAVAEGAFVNPDFEFILLSDAIDSPPVEELVQWLRRDYRTARQPIGVMARGERLSKLTETFAGDPLVSVFPRIHSVEVVMNEVDKLKAIAGRNLVGAGERVAEALSALSALIVLAKNPTTFSQYSLDQLEPAVIRALNSPPLAAEAAALLALYATAKAQTALVDFASQNSRPLADRQAAAAAFVAAVKTRGIGLTQGQIALQYDRYNSSQSLDKPTQELLGSILDAIESRAIARGELQPAR
jgi:tetratricopeptide (TPR) repeat protein